MRSGTKTAIALTVGTNPCAPGPRRKPIGMATAALRANSAHHSSNGRASILCASLSFRSMLALLVVASVALSGCATRLPPIPSNAYVRGQVPAGGLPTVARIVANDLPIDLVGFWNNPKERAEFEKRRSENIDRRVENRPSGLLDGKAVGNCILYGPLCLVILPVAIPLALAGSYTEARIKAGHAEPSIPISEKDSARLVALFTEGLSGVSLSERTWRLIESAAVPSAKEAEHPRLLISMRSALVRQEMNSMRITIIAQAQAYPSAGVEWAPTGHVIDLEFRPKDDYVLGIQKILDVLAQSIVAIYLPEHAFSVEHRHWDSVSSMDGAQVQTYLDRYPDGKFADLARERIAALTEAARRRAAQVARERVAAGPRPTDIPVSAGTSTSSSLEGQAALAGRTLATDSPPADALPMAGASWQYAYTMRGVGSARHNIGVRVAGVDGGIVREIITTPSFPEQIVSVSADSLNFRSFQLPQSQTLVDLAPYLHSVLAKNESMMWGKLAGYPAGNAVLPPWTITVREFGQEEITVPAGTFKARRIEVSGRRRLSGSIPFHLNYESSRFLFRAWYAPEVRRYVRLQHETWALNGTWSGEQLVELTSYTAK